MRIWAAFTLLFLTLGCGPAFAQGNPTCPTRPAGDSTNACASTAFVQGAASVPFITCPANQFVNKVGNTSTCTSITNSFIPAGAADTYKGSLNGTTTTDISFPSCVGAGKAIQYTTGVGPSCGTAAAGRILLNTATNFFVDVTLGVDQVGCGLASGTSACHTRGYLHNILASNYDFGNQTVTVNLAAGTYNDSLQASGGLIPGQASGSSYIWTGPCTVGHRSDVLIQPSGGGGYAYSADGGISYRIQCQVLDQTNQRSVFPGGADIVVVGHGSKIYFGNPSLYAAGTNPDVEFGCNFNGFNAVTAAFGAYVEWDNDFNINVGRCQQTPTGTPTNGSATITSVSSTTNVFVGMGIVASGVPSDAYVASTTINTIVMACAFTSPCQATSSPGSETITLVGGGQSFLDMGNNATGYFNTNGEPDFALIATLGGFPTYRAGFFFINEGSTINAQSITFVNSTQANGVCSVVKTLSNIDTNLQGIPYLPCKAQSAEVTQSSVSVTAGAGSITVASTTGIKAGMILADVAAPTATFTAAASTMTVSSNSGIAIGAKVTGPGILTGAVVTNVSGTTITVGGCGPGPKCPSGSPLYISETGQTVYFTNSTIGASCTVSFISSATVFNVQADTALGAGCIKSTTTIPNLWFQGQVIRNSVYD